MASPFRGLVHKEWKTLHRIWKACLDASTQLGKEPSPEANRYGVGS